MITPFDEVAEIVGIPCNDCGGGGFVILSMRGDVEKMSCDCIGEEDEFFPFNEFGECD